MKLSIRVAVSLVAAALITAAVVVPVAAARFYGSGIYALFGPATDTDLRGLVVVDRANGEHPRLTVALVHLAESEEYFVVARRIGCDGTPSDSNRVFRRTGWADANGAAFGRSALQVGKQYGDVLTIWVRSGGTTTCAVSLDFAKIDHTVGGADAGLSLTKVGSGTLILLVEKLPMGKARLGLTGVGVGNAGALRVRGSAANCGSPPGQTMFDETFNNLGPAWARFRRVDLMQAERDALRTIRVDTGNMRDCSNITLVEVLVA